MAKATKSTSARGKLLSSAACLTKVRDALKGAKQLGYVPTGVITRMGGRSEIRITFKRAE